jgi:tetratricopeptide (TPR) repeat protein
MDLGVFEARMDNYSVAEPLFRRAETVTEGAFPLLESQCALSLGALCQRMAHPDEAEKFYTRAGELLARRLGAEHPEVFICQYYLATVCDAKGDYAKAEQLLKGCASYFSNPPPRFKTRKLDPTFYNDQVYRGPFQPNYVYAADSLNRLARIYQRQNRAADAEACLTESLKLADANLPKGDPEIQAALDRLVGYQLAQRNYPGAETVLVEFLKSREKVLGTDHGMILRANETLASVYEMENKHSEAEALRKRIREMPRK